MTAVDRIKTTEFIGSFVLVKLTTGRDLLSTFLHKRVINSKREQAFKALVVVRKKSLNYSKSIINNLGSLKFLTCDLSLRHVQVSLQQRVLRRELRTRTATMFEHLVQCLRKS